MQEVSFDEALSLILAKDPRYQREAYLFVREALDHTQRTIAKDPEGRIRHVSGQELLAGIREFALAQFGPMAMMVLEEWGIKDCQAFGEIVFNMVETSSSPDLTAGDSKSPGDILDAPAFASRLARQADPVSQFLWSQLSEPLRQRLLANQAQADCEQALVTELNRIIATLVIYDPTRFAAVRLSDRVKCLVDRQLQGIQLALFNRMLLEEAYPQEIEKSHGLLAKTQNDTRADFSDGYNFYDAFRKPFLPSQQPERSVTPATSSSN